jgi:hypothetical protein
VSTRTGQSRLPTATRRAVVGVGAFIAAVIITKLIIISHDEIEAMGADHYGYALLAMEGYFGRSYGKYTHTRQPGYPLFLSACSVLGLPVRLAIEAVLAAAAALTLAALRTIGVRLWLAAGAFALLLWCPWTLRIFDRLIVDAFYAPVALAFLSSLAAAASCVVTRREAGAALTWSVLAGITGAIAANTRPESILLLGSLGVAGLLVALIAMRARRDAGRRAAVIAAVALCTVVPLLLIQAATFAAARLNRATIGVAVTYDLALPGYRALYRTLLAIPPQSPRLDNPIPRDVLAKAYVASPAFARLKDPLERDPGVLAYQTAAEQATGGGLKGEFGAWAVWALRNAAFVAGRHKWASAKEIDEFYTQAADELRQAMRDGRLERRFVLVDFVPPHWGQLARALPASTANCIRMLGHSSPAPPAPPVAAEMAVVFDQAALRRGALVLPGGSAGGPTHHWRRPAVAERLLRIQHRVFAANGPVMMLCAAALAGGILLAALRRRGLVSVAWWCAVAIFTTAFLARLMLAALLDATGIGVQIRYLLPNALMLIVGGVLGLEAILSTLNARPGRAVAATPERPTPSPSDQPAPDTTPPSA